MHLLYTHLVYSIALTVAIVIVAVSSGLTVLWFRRFRSASSAAARSGAVCARGSSAKGTETEAMMAACDVVY
jgi:membrane protein implicated in regulation of membrane protease activity